MTAEPDRCLTCGDVAVAAKVLAVEGATALVDVEGRTEQVGIELVAPVERGDVLLCHAGIALEQLE
ncbi:MAG TPA: HypC/HybG/HupF family hydrogenase formation chaperone [Gaiellaceae bacterium]|nr:HypC/HybG/HupF family hydrogenase formation chaperone [Gaiellaceae bacterium]